MIFSKDDFRALIETAVADAYQRGAKDFDEDPEGWNDKRLTYVRETADLYVRQNTHEVDPRDALYDAIEETFEGDDVLALQGGRIYIGESSFSASAVERALVGYEVLAVGPRPE